MSKEEIIFNAMQRYLGTKDGANDIRFKSVDELKEHMSESPDMKLFLEVMDEYANQTEAQKLDEKVEWLSKNQESVICYKVSKEVADYIRATHTKVSPDFYLLPSGYWVRLIEQEPKEKGFISKYHVKSGSFRVTLEARNHKMAVIKAIDENCPVDLGVIISCLKEGDSQEDEIYMNTESVLNDMWFKEGYTDNNIAKQN